MRAALLVVVGAFGLAGCNQILGNGNFAGPPADACTGATCPPADAAVDATPMIDASMACEDMAMPPTRIIGHVFAPNGTTPLPNVLVYIPQHAPDALSATTTCGCIPATGGVVMQQLTGIDGGFMFTDAPSGSDIPLVIQTGKWRRQITIPSVTMCADTTLDASQTHLPRNASEGDLPRIAITTGAADTLECLVRQLGVDDAEIGTIGDARRVHLVAGTGPGATMFQAGFAGGSGNFATLPALLPTLGGYDELLMSCEGQVPTISAADAQLVHDFANAGGHVLLEHYHRQWLVLNADWNAIATFNDATFPATGQITILNSFPKGQLLISWLSAIGASTNGVFTVQNPRNSVATLDVAKAQVWAQLDAADRMGSSGDQIFTFDTPLGASTPCGRVIFSDMHETVSGGGPTIFPQECTDPALVAQQDVLAFLFFDHTTCAP